MPRFFPVEQLFAGRHFDVEIVVLCVRWYLRFKLSCRDLVSMMSDTPVILPLLDLFCQFDSANHDVRRLETLQSQHWS